MEVADRVYGDDPPSPIWKVAIARGVWNYVSPSPGETPISRENLSMNPHYGVKFVRLIFE